MDLPNLQLHCDSDKNFYRNLLLRYKEVGEDYKIYWKGHSEKTKLSDIKNYDLMWYIDTYKDDNDYRGLWAEFFIIVLNDRRIKKIKKLKDNVNRRRIQIEG